MLNNHKKNWNRIVRDTWVNVLEDDSYSVTGTLKFNQGAALGRTAASQILKSYWHKLDRIFFGHAANKGVGIERWIFSEYGEDGCNLHFHFKAKAPIEPYYFCCISNVIWARFHRHTAKNIYNWITPTLLGTNSSCYTVKDTRHFTYDTAGLEASHQNKSHINTATFQNAAQAKRIITNLSIDEIKQAQQIVDLQIEQTKQRIFRRQR
jgi:hypothetical protein